MLNRAEGAPPKVGEARRVSTGGASLRAGGEDGGAARPRRLGVYPAPSGGVFLGFGLSTGLRTAASYSSL